jgi:prophage regulatory protein
MIEQSSGAPVRLIRRPEVEKRVGLKRPTIYALMKQGKFPRQRKLTANCVAWVEAEIDAWIAERIAA